MIIFPFPCTPQFLDLVIPLIADGLVEIPAALSNDWTTVATKTLKNYRGWITAYGVTVYDPSWDWNGSLAFQFLINDTPFPAIGQGAWTTQRGSVDTPQPTLVRVPINARITLQARRAVAAANAQQVGMIALGFVIPPSTSEGKDAGEFRV